MVVSFNACLIDHALDKFKNFCRDAKMKPLHRKNNFLSQVKFLKDDKIETVYVIYDFEKNKTKTNRENHRIISKS